MIPQTCPQPSSFYTHLPSYEDGAECSETSAYKIQTPGNHPKESIQHSGHGESLKSRTPKIILSGQSVLKSIDRMKILLGTYATKHKTLHLLFH